MEKAIAKKAKENSRANRDEDMDYFVAYYNNKFAGHKFLALKKEGNHPSKIAAFFEDAAMLKKIKKYIDNDRQAAKQKLNF